MGGGETGYGRQQQTHFTDSEALTTGRGLSPAVATQPERLIESLVVNPFEDSREMNSLSPESLGVIPYGSGPSTQPSGGQP